MNLFYLDENHELNAQYHIDKHVSKMVLETAEMLSMAHWVDEVLGFVPRKLEVEEYREVVKYKSAYKDFLPEDRHIPYLGRDQHLNHPSSIWVRSSVDNYEWAFCYMHSLELERRYRNPSGVPIHKSFSLVLEKLDTPKCMRRVGFTKFALAMKNFIEQYPDLVNEEDPIQTYRYFYQADKTTFASWKGRDKPYWWDDSFAKNHQLRN